MSNLATYVFAFVLLLGVLIVVHELGHYLVARMAGVKILRFSVGFGRPILTVRIGRDGTEWSIGVFPLGGYVKMLDEAEGEVAPGELHRSFNRQSVWKRIAIVVAGPLANLVLALFVYWGLFLHGTEELRPILGAPVAESPAAVAGLQAGDQVLRIGGEEVETWAEMRWILLRSVVEQDSIELELVNRRQEISFHTLDLQGTRGADGAEDPIEKLGLTFFRPSFPPVLGTIVTDSVAARAGLAPGDVVVSIDGRPVGAWDDVVQTVRASAGRPLLFEYRRSEKTRTVELTPMGVESGGRLIGRIGAAVDDSGFDRNELMVTVRYGVVQAFGKAVEETWSKSVFSLQMIGKMVTGALSWRYISGPVTIADYAGQSAKLGVTQYLKFMALVSISLAVLNMLPVPILDGGHLLYYVAEIIRGRPLTERCMVLGQKIGLALILMLMAFALYNDLTRLIPV